MNILIAGYGNVGKAISSMLEKHPIEDVGNIYIAELKDGNDAASSIIRLKDELDVVIDATPDEDSGIIPLCEKYNIQYIDTCYTLTPEMKEILSPAAKFKSPNIKMWGCGMNPGMIEYMYRKQNPGERHIVIEFETDTAQHGDDLFHTWSLEEYFKETSIDAPYAIINGEMHYISNKKSKADVELMIDGQKRKYLWTPHEELCLMAMANPHCKLAAFLYSCAHKVQEHAILLRKNKELLQTPIPTLHDISGCDRVGLLICSKNSPLSYIYNEACHQECYKKYSVNGTSWQVACGVYVALILIPYLKPGNHTFSNLDTKLFPVVDETLEKIGFEIKTTNTLMEETDFWQKIVEPYFPAIAL